MSESLLFIVGPTASGKTELALKEATRRGAVILSCDSLCFYRGMDIGTAKPTAAERAMVPHYGIDLVEPDETFSISRYIEYRDEVLSRMKSEGRPVVVAGGSGFYLKSFFSPVIDRLDVPAEVTKRAEAIRRDEGPDGLIKALRACNPGGETFEGLDLLNPRRVEKALIRCLSSGRGYSQLRQEFLSIPEPLSGYSKEVWLIDRPISEMQERNRWRVRKMLESGLIEEVEALRRQGFERNPSACGAIGYQEVLEYLLGDVTREHLEELIITHTNQLMRKQRTWFRRQIPVAREVGS